MRQYCCSLIIALAGFVLIASAAPAGEPFGKLAPYWRAPTPYYVGNPKTIAQKRDVPPQTLQWARTHTAYPRAYPYGYFGAQARPYRYASSGYYNAADQTTFGWGY